MVPRDEGEEAALSTSQREALEASQSAAQAAVGAQLEVATRGRAEAEEREASLREEVRAPFNPPFDSNTHSFLTERELLA